MVPSGASAGGPPLFLLGGVSTGAVARSHGTQELQPAASGSAPPVPGVIAAIAPVLQRNPFSASPEPGCRRTKGLVPIQRSRHRVASKESPPPGPDQLTSLAALCPREQKAAPSTKPAPPGWPAPGNNLDPPPLLAYQPSKLQSGHPEPRGSPASHPEISTGTGGGASGSAVKTAQFRVRGCPPGKAL